MSAASRGIEAIADDDYLLRRIPDQPEQMWTRRDGMLRPSSAAMKPASEGGGMSVDVRRLLGGAPPLSVLAGREGDGLVEFQAKVPRDLGLDAIHTPLPDRYSHADVVGFSGLEPAEAKRARRELAKRAAWVQNPASADAA